MPESYRLVLPYREARRRILQADLLLWRPTNPMGRLIAHGTGGEYSHAGMACWFGDVLLQLETLQRHGGRAANLSWQVRQWPGACDVYRIRQSHAGLVLPAMAATESMMRRTGQPYGWLDLAHAALHVACPWLRDHKMDFAPWSHPLFCSAAVADSLRRAGYDILPGWPVWSITPNDLANVGEFQFTIGWE